MGYEEHQCPRCGAAVPARSAGVVHCAYCATPLVPTRDGFRVSSLFTEESLVNPDRPRFWLAGSRYRMLGRLAEGETSDVFLALRDHRLVERVIVKVLRAHEDRDLFDGEWRTLTELQKSTARGSAHFTRLLPQPVAHGEGRLGVRGDEGLRRFSVFGFASGFVHGFGDVRETYPRGVPASSAVWLWKRTLELLAFVHESGWVHGAVLPRHLLVHARDHGVRLCGWSAATALGKPLPAFPADADAFYPGATWKGGPATAATDISMSARSILWILGGDLREAPKGTPAGLARLMETCAAPDAGGFTDARRAIGELDDAAREAYGPPKFIPFAMPGWNIAAG
ncbi:MAG: hypothetical protein DRJ42_11885 [Deltaproteobacteria bacterium]|nr:MAG: hypothetical protein DRJ42_11885 [Deltaproteobacteria bacterium]